MKKKDKEEVFVEEEPIFNSIELAREMRRNINPSIRNLPPKEVDDPFNYFFSGNHRVND